MVSQTFALRSPLRSLCLNTVLVLGWIIVAMTTHMRRYRNWFRSFRLLQPHHYVRKLLTHRRGLVVLVLVLVASLFAAVSQLQQVEIIHVLHPGFPLIVRADDSYPSVLEHDVSGKIPYQVQQAFESRSKQYLDNRLRSPRKGLLSVNSRLPSCPALIKGDNAEISNALQFMDEYEQDKILPLSFFINAPSDCDNFLKYRGYINHALPEEYDFPIAYSIMMYRDAAQAERLLRAIYRPSNFYCIHVDAKAEQQVQEAMAGIAKCLPNVFLASKQNIVNWAQFNSLEPWIYCMRDLWKFSWKYFINLTGQEFPLKTNLQIVRILKALNGSNVVDTTTYGHYARRWYENLPPPNNIQPYKGLVFVVVSRGYVDYILHNPVAQKLLEWVSHTDFPDESYFSTLNHNPHLAVPGSYRGDPETNADSKPYIARFVNWGVGWIDSQGRYPFYWPCGGKRVRRVCIFGVKDLKLLVDRRELFANKFILDFEYLALDCLEEWHFNMTLAEYAGKLEIDTAWYRSLDIVKNKVL